MTERINGGFRPGVWVEQEVRCVRVVFSASVAAAAGKQPNSPVDKALRWLAQYGTILGTSELHTTGTVVDVLLGYAANVTAAANDGILGNDIVVTGIADDGTATGALTADFTLNKFQLAVAAETMGAALGGQVGFFPQTDYQS